jgi:hypothetical protein
VARQPKPKPTLPPELTQPEPVPAPFALPPEFEAAINDAIIETMKDKPGELPAYMRTRNARQAFQDAFETIGGLPRLALWAHYNYGRFIHLYSKLVPITLTGDGDHPIRIDAPWLTQRRFGTLPDEDPPPPPRREPAPPHQPPHEPATVEMEYPDEANSRQLLLPLK